MKKIHTVLALISLASFSVMAESFSIVCHAPDTQTLNRFEGQGVVEADKKEDGSFDVKSAKFKFTITPAGFTAESKEVEASGMLSKFRYVESEFTAKPFYQLTMIKNSESSEIASINILTDYPGALDSSIRLQNGMTFKASCDMQ